jgi:hypothetical protein
MNEFTYIFIIILLTIFVLLYGGHNNQDLIEYDSNYFKNFEKIILFEKKLQIYNKTVNFNNDNFICIKNFIKTCTILIPNLYNLFFINIQPHSFFKINKLFNNNFNKKEYVMIIFNHNNINNLELLVGLDSINYGYFYDLKKNISIVGLYDLFNSSDVPINFTIFISKKPFWYS